jgi:hypothetical protein
VLEGIERSLVEDVDRSDGHLQEAFARFERAQPHLASDVGRVLERPLDETALALGYFLSIAIWLAFETSFGARVVEVSPEALRATEDAVALEEELRASHGEEPLDVDDVVALEQPGVLAFVHEHVDAALDVRARVETGEEDEDVDVEDVHLVYRTIVVLTLALSHAVTPADSTRESVELLA